MISVVSEYVDNALQETDIVSIGILLSFLIWFIFPNPFKKKSKNRKRGFIQKYGSDIQKMKKMDWKDFEFLCGELFEKRGWRTSVQEESGADGGVDVWARRGGELALVQCKRYEKTKVGVKVVRELFGLMQAENAQSGYIVTTSGFTKDAFKFAKGKRISLIDGKQLESITKKLI